MTIPTIEEALVTEFTETEIERSLRHSLAPLAIEAGHGMTDRPWICDFAGWRDAAGPSADFLRAVNAARPFPKNLASVWVEYQEWQALHGDRADLAPGYHFPTHVAARVSALEHLMDTLPDPTADGLRARFAWLRHLARLDHYRTNDEDAGLAGRMSADFDSFVRSVHSGQARPTPTWQEKPQRTQADRRREVLSILVDEPALSDREIARRCGVSPQTVNNWRRKVGAGA